MKIIALVLTSLIIFLPCSLAYSAEKAAKEKKPQQSPAKNTNLSVQQAINEGLLFNPAIRSLEASVKGAKGGVATARTLANPELSFAPGVKRIAEGDISSHEFHANIELSQLFEFPGKRALKIAIAEKNVALQQLALEGFRFEFSAKVKRAFYGMLAAQKMAALREEQVASAKTFLDSTKQRAESGYISDFETLKSEADFIAAQRESLSARGKVAEVKAVLNTLLGRPASGVLTVSGDLDGGFVRKGSAVDYVSLALTHNSSLRTIKMQAENAGLSLRATRFGTRPDFAVGPQVEYTKSEQIYGFGVTVALPLWDRKKGEIATATAEQERLLAEIDKSQVEITGAVAVAAENLRVSREQAALYSPDFLSRLKELMTQAEKGYAANATTLIIYLDAKRTYFDTLAEYYESLGNVAERTAELESAVGAPLEQKP